MVKSYAPLLGGRLAVDFVNSLVSSEAPSWERFIEFLEASGVVSQERSAHLLQLPQNDPQAAELLIMRAGHLSEALHRIFAAMVHKERVAKEWVAPLNQVLRITEGHDELVWRNEEWQLEFLARESGLDWLLAAIARSGAEILTEGPAARLRLCANPHCGLFFTDTSRTRRRRWCSMARCGNRHKVAAFARRQRTQRVN